MRFLAIDPGVEFGYAVFDISEPLPESFGVYSPTKGTWLDRCRASSEMLEALIDDSDVQRVICEWPAYRESATGRAAAAADSLVKLSVVVGMFVQVCNQLNVPFEPVPVPTWMGNMGERILKHRIQRLMGNAAMPVSHALDAVGIGFWKRGLL